MVWTVHRLNDMNNRHGCHFGPTTNTRQLCAYREGWASAQILEVCSVELVRINRPATKLHKLLVPELLVPQLRLSYVGGGWLSWWRALLLRQHTEFEFRHPSEINNKWGRMRRIGQHPLARRKNIQKKKVWAFVLISLSLGFFPRLLIQTHCTYET